MIASFRSFALALAIGAGSFAATSLATAQDEASFVKSFSGDWYVFDPQFGSGDETCSMTLSTDKRTADARFDANAKGCVQPLSEMAAWDIHSGQLRLFAQGSDNPFALLGGNQLRITGSLPASERGIIVERAEGDDSTSAIAKAIARHRCIYVGFSQECADVADLVKPALTEEAGSYGSVSLLVNLNVRDQPRSNAPNVGVLQAGTCLKVNFCTTASDGIWCRARFGERNGWVHKIAVRKEEWPVLTFTNSCPSEE